MIGPQRLLGAYAAKQIACTYALLVCVTFSHSSPQTSNTEHSTRPLPTDDGYHGIWYMNQPSKDEYKYKYSGGFATYPQQHMPIAIYSKKANKTFFCYGGTTTTG